MLKGLFGGGREGGQAASAARETPTAGQRVKILMVDDNPGNLLSLEAVLESLGEELVQATSGREALKRCLEDDFAVILLDVKMPDMDGFETAQLIRARDRSRHTPILFLTGYRNEEQLYRGYYMGAVDFLFKPIVPEILRSKVAVFVELSRNSTLLKRQAEILQTKNAELESSIHERHKAEQRFRSLLEAAPDAMLVSNAAGTIELVNSRAESLFGRQRDEMVGQSASIVVPEWSYQVRERVEEASERFEWTGLRADGTRFPLEVTFRPLRTEEGVTLISAVRDITQRRQAEEQARQLNAELERRVAERTAELQRSNEELRQFAYVASHDLQEPLRTVASYTQLLAKRYQGQMGPEADEFVQYVVQGVHRMRDLINDLLAYSRVELREASFQPVSADAVLHEARMNLQSAIQDNGADVSSGPLPEVTADPMQLVQLFQNLIGNAIKYRHPDRSPVVRVEAIEAEGEFEFSVRDNGIGIEPEYLESIFGIFKRLHSRERYPGTGVGLAICKKIVERHGGRIWVESVPGEGSTFRFTLPV